MAELTKEEKKAIRKEKIKKFFKIFGIVCGAAAASGIGAYGIYTLGKSKGQEEAFNPENPEMKLIKGMVATDAIDRFKEEQFLIALDSGFYGSEFHNDKTGEVKYLIATVQDEKADWMNDENKLPNLAEAISNDIVEGK